MTYASSIHLWALADMAKHTMTPDEKFREFQEFRERILMVLNKWVSEALSKGQSLSTLSGVEYCKKLIGFLPIISNKQAKQSVPSETAAKNYEKHLKEKLGWKFFYKRLILRNECRGHSFETASLSGFISTKNLFGFLYEALVPENGKQFAFGLSNEIWINVFINKQPSTDPEKKSFRMYCILDAPSVVHTDPALLKELSTQLAKAGFMGAIKVSRQLSELLTRKDAVVVYAKDSTGLRNAHDIINAFLTKRGIKTQYEYGVDLWRSDSSLMSYHEALSKHLFDSNKFGVSGLEFDQLLKKSKAIEEFIERRSNIAPQLEPSPKIGSEEQQNPPGF